MGKGSPVDLSLARSAYLRISITFSPWPTLDLLRLSLGVRWANTGRQFNLVGPSGIVTDDLEGLHAVTDETGRVTFRSGPEFPMASYRGQPRDYPSCLPTLARLKHPEEQLLALCRCVAFEDVIGDHPYVRICEAATFLGASFFVDREGLAQHYGLATNLLDVTNSFDVASFFATCAWENDRGFQPIQSSKSLGVIYQVQPYFLMLAQEQVEYRDVGWQPLHRPEQQRAAAFRMPKGIDFESLLTVNKHYFSHNARSSNKIWRMFDGGKVLFPSDAPAELAYRAGLLMRFTRSQIDRAWCRYDEWHASSTDADAKLGIETVAGFEVVDTPQLSWDGLLVEQEEARLRENLSEVMNRVRYRRVAAHWQG